MQKKYDPKIIEPKWQRFWEEEGIFKFDPKGPTVFSIDTPPPTVSGKMHIGHASSYSHMDFIARYKRMRGYDIFYPFGTDDNGLRTEMEIEKINGVKSENMKREEFIQLCLKTLKKITPDFIQDWKNIGLSADWSLYYSTIDDHSRKISQESFIDLYNMGREYRKESPFLWCTNCQTGISQNELEDKEKKSQFHDLVFKSDGKDLLISTTRPEMLPACVAVFVHPDDKRYKDMAGKKAKVPLFGQEVPILKDKRVDPEKGTGMVMCCTFGDQTDIEWYLAHNLRLKEVITKDGKMKNTGKYSGKSVKEARKQIVEDLKKEGLLKKSENLTHTVNVHEDCDQEIEILNTKQWFIKYLDLKEKFLELGEKLEWYPEFMKNRYNNWVKGLQWDWCISRQRHFGVPIPVWYCKKCGEIKLPDKEQLPVDPMEEKPKTCCKCGSDEFDPEKDVLDTWATSSLTPEISIGLIKDKVDFPMDLRPQAHDIISFWLFNTVVKSWLHKRKLPWEKAMISGWVLDPKGRKMSKSKGNIVRPQEILEKYSADALRYWAAESKVGEDMPFQEKDLVAANKFLNKLWNASKFVSNHMDNNKPERPEKLEVGDEWILSRMNKVIEDSTKKFDNFEFAKAKREVENFFWNEFCDNYLEMIKYRVYGEKKDGANYTLYRVLLNSLKMLSPFIPHITEEIYQNFYREREGDKSIHISRWPDKEYVKNQNSEEIGELAKNIIEETRNWKSSNGIPLNREIAKITVACEEEVKEKIKKVEKDIMNTTKARNIEFNKVEDGIEKEGFKLKLKA